MQFSSVLSSLNVPICVLRLLQGALGSHRDECIQLGIELLDAMDACECQLPRREVFCA